MKGHVLIYYSPYRLEGGRWFRSLRPGTRASLVAVRADLGVIQARWDKKTRLRYRLVPRAALPRYGL